MDVKDKRNDPPAVQVDWTVLIAIAIGFAVVTAASIQAGEGGLAANVIDYVAPSKAES